MEKLDEIRISAVSSEEFERIKKENPEAYIVIVKPEKKSE